MNALDYAAIRSGLFWIKVIAGLGFIFSFLVVLGWVSGLLPFEPKDRVVMAKSTAVALALVTACQFTLSVILGRVLTWIVDRISLKP